MLSLSRRIGLFGNFGTGNFGNEGSLESMLLFLRQARPDAELTCICVNPEKVQRDYQIPALPISWPGHRLLRKFTNWFHAVAAMRKFDVLLVPGTGILNDYCAPPFGLPYGLFRWCLAARLCGAKVLFMNVGAGPVHHPVSRWFIKSATRLAQYRSYRNNFSKEFVKSLGLDTSNDPVYPDIAFTLPLPVAPARTPAEVSRLTVGVGVMVYHGWFGHRRIDNRIYEAHLIKVKEIVLWLLDSDRRVRLLMGDEMDQQAVEDLQKVVAAERPSLPEGMLLAERAHSCHDVMRQMADTDIVISARFHHLVFGLKLGKPVISIGYAEYHTNLMAEMGLAAFCQHSDQMKIELVRSQFEELVLKRSHYETVISNALASCRRRLAQQEHMLMSQFLEEAPSRIEEEVAN